MTERVANIGEPGARRRRASGVVWLAISAASCAGLFAFHEPRPMRALLVIPLTLSGLGFFQARDKT